MTEYQKLETIHSALLEVELQIPFNLLRPLAGSGAVIRENLDQAITLVEEIREKYFDEDGNLIEGALDED